MRSSSLCVWISYVICLNACGPNSPGGEENSKESSEDGSESAARCGDGVVDLEIGETCDDGNALRGDGCSPECLHSGTHLACVDILSGSIDNEVRGLVESLDGSVLVAGSVVTDAGRRAWIARFEIAGERLWFHEVAANEDQAIVALAQDGEGGGWALVSGNSSQVVHRYGASGTNEGITTIDPEFRVYAIESGAGDLWLAGKRDGDAWVGRLDPAGGSISTVMLEDHAGYDDFVAAIGRHGDAIAVAATVSTTPNADGDQLVVAQTDVLIVEYDLDGNERARGSLGPSSVPDMARRATHVVSDGEAWVVAGWQEPIDLLPLGQIWAARSTPALEWSSLVDVEDMVGANLGALLTFESNIVLVGSRYGEGGGVGWFVGIDREGAVTWESVHEDGNRHEEWQIVITSRGLVALTDQVTSGESSQIRLCTIAL